MLLSVPSHHLVLVLVHFRLAFQQGSLLVLRKDHVSLRLLLLLLGDAGLLVVFLDHAMHNSVHLCLLFHVLFVSLLSQEVSLINLILDLTLVVNKLIELIGIVCSLILVANLLVTQDGQVDLGVLLLFN